MPHLLIERLRTTPDLFLGWEVCPCAFRKDSKGQKARCAVFVEVLDILGGITFIYGSICFMPQSDEAGNSANDLLVLKRGCLLFMLGGAIYAGIALYATLESIEAKGWVSLETLENVFYVIGSFVFLVGTFLYWPWDMSDERAMLTFRTEALTRGVSVTTYLNTFSPAFEGTVLFIVGSLIFAFASFINALNISKFNASFSSQLLTCATSSYMVGSLLFAMGSIAFLPNFGCNRSMEALGAWLFIFGSSFFEGGSLISFFRTIRELDNPDWDSPAKSPRRVMRTQSLNSRFRRTDV